jgi:hypothetical protein
MRYFLRYVWRRLMGELCEQCPTDDPVECMKHADNGYDRHGKCGCPCHRNVVTRRGS